MLNAMTEYDHRMQSNYSEHWLRVIMTGLLRRP
jgi:hypothetical protein